MDTKNVDDSSDEVPRATDTSGGGDSRTKLIGRVHWLLAVVVGSLLAGVAAFLVLVYDVPQYEASALLLIEDRVPFIAFTESTSEVDSQRYVRAQEELLRSPRTLESAIQRLGTAALPELKSTSAPVEDLQERLKFTRLGDSELYKVTYSSPSAEAAAQIVNGIVSEYLSVHINDEFDRSQRLIELLENERVRREGEVRRLRQRLLQLSVDATGKDPFGHNLTLLQGGDPDALSSLRQTLVGIEIDHALLEEELQAHKSGLVDVDETESTTSGEDEPVASAPDIQSLQAAIEEMESLVMQIKKLDSDGGDDPNFVRLVEQVQLQRAAFDALKNGLMEQQRKEQSAQQKHDRERSIAQIQEELADLATRKKVISQQLMRMEEQQKDRGSQLVAFEAARADLAREEAVFELIASRKMALQTEMLAPPRVTSRAAATAPKQPASGLPYGRLAIACSAAFFLPFVFAIAFRSSRTGKVNES